MGVAFLDEASENRTLTSALFWLVVLTAGRFLVTLYTYVRLRGLTIELALRPSRNVADLPLLTRLDRLMDKELFVAGAAMAEF